MKANTLIDVLGDMEANGKCNPVILIQTGDNIYEPGIVKEIVVNGQAYLVLTDAEPSSDDLVSLEIEEMTTGREYVNLKSKEDNNEN